MQISSWLLEVAALEPFIPIAIAATLLLAMLRLTERVHGLAACILTYYGIYLAFGAA